MDLQILPDGLTEPTLSGAVFQRQAQVRWTQPVSNRFRVDVSIEDPSNRDVISDAPVATASRLQAFDGVTMALELESGLLPVGQAPGLGTGQVY